MSRRVPKRKLTRNAYIAVQSSFVNCNGSHNSTAVTAGNAEHSSSLFLQCHGVAKDDTDATYEVQGPETTSLAIDKVEEGSGLHFTENNTSKKVVGGGGRDTLTTAMTVTNGQRIIIDSNNSSTVIRSKGGNGSVTAERFVGGNSTVTINERNKNTKIVVGGRKWQRKRKLRHHN